MAFSECIDYSKINKSIKLSIDTTLINNKYDIKDIALNMIIKRSKKYRNKKNKKGVKTVLGFVHSVNTIQNSLNKINKIYNFLNITLLCDKSYMSKKKNS